MPRKSKPRKAAGKHRTSTFSKKKRGKGGKKQQDGSTHKIMGDLYEDYGKEPSAIDTGDPNYVLEEEDSGSFAVYRDSGQNDKMNFEEYMASTNTKTIENGQNYTVEQKAKSPPEPQQMVSASSQTNGLRSLQNTFSSFFRIQTPSGNVKQIEAELVQILNKHAPEKKGNISFVLRQYKGRETLLLKEVQEKYGIVQEKLDIGIKQELQKLYSKHNPKKYGNIDKLLIAYKGREQTLVREVRQKYCSQNQPKPAPVAP